jgi:type I restriction enzyme S subunit
LNLLASNEITPAVRRWKAYPAYMESGLEWLPEMPSHWEMRRLKFVLLQPLQYGANEEAGETDIALPRFVRITDINERGELRADTFRSLAHEQAKPYLLEEGDLLLARSGATVGKSFQYKNSWGKCCFAGYLIRARLDQKRCLPDFLNYFTSSANYWDWIASSLIQATIQNVSAEKYGNLSVSLPHISEQRSIVMFLDRETAKIDALVAKKERLIDLLQEKRAALITRAVTKGLDPNVPVKDSDVEWLGEIPAHWEIKKVKHLAKVVSKGTTPTTVGSEFLAQGIRFIKAENIDNGKISDEPATFIDSATDELLRRSRLQSQDVLMVIAGATTGKVGIIDATQTPANTNQAVAFIRLENPTISRFLFYWLTGRKIQEQVWLKAVQAAQPNLSLDDISNFIVPVPAAAEIELLTKYLDAEATKLEALVAKIREGIEKLKEYRTALISAAVTGKIDVREDVVS